MLRMWRSLTVVYFQVFSNLLIYLNASSNFIIFAIMGRRFRQVIRQSFCRRKTKTPSLSNLQMLRGLASIAAPVVNIPLDKCPTSTDTVMVEMESSTTKSGSIEKFSPSMLTIVHTKLRKTTKTWAVKHNSELFSERNIINI